MGRHGVARIGAAAAPAWAALLLPLLLLAGAACPGARAGQTSEYRRHLGSAIDMPLDADVFRPPPGHNAPEQVRHRLGWHRVPRPAVRSSRLLFFLNNPASPSRYTSRRSSMLSACGISDSSRICTLFVFFFLEGAGELRIIILRRKSALCLSQRAYYPVRLSLTPADSI